MLFISKMVHVPVGMVCQDPTNWRGQTMIEALQVSFTAKVADALIVMPNQVPTNRRDQVPIEALQV